MTSPLVFPPGEPNLVTAILAASRFLGAGYVHRFDGVEGWHVGQSIPRGVSAYYRVFANQIHVRDPNGPKGAEYYFGKIVGQEIIPER